MLWWMMNKTQPMHAAEAMTTPISRQMETFLHRGGAMGKYSVTVDLASMQNKRGGILFCFERRITGKAWRVPDADSSRPNPYLPTRPLCL